MVAGFQQFPHELRKGLSGAHDDAFGRILLQEGFQFRGEPGIQLDIMPVPGGVSDVGVDPRTDLPERADFVTESLVPFVLIDPGSGFRHAAFDCETRDEE